MTSTRRLALTLASCLCLALAGCKHGDGGAPPGAGGPPPGQGAPGAPVAPGGGGGGGHGAPGAPYQIPGTVLLQGIELNDENWAEIEKLFWANCPGRGQCVRPVRVFVPQPDKKPCEFLRVEPPIGRRLAYGSVITVYGAAPCSPGGGGSSPGDSPPVSPGDSPGQSAPPASP
jgi:hypothetical protein